MFRMINITCTWYIRGLFSFFTIYCSLSIANAVLSCKSVNHQKMRELYYSVKNKNIRSKYKLNDTNSNLVKLEKEEKIKTKESF